MSGSLWPNIVGTVPPRGTRQMLQEMAGDISALTNGKIELYIDTVGIGPSGAVFDLRHNCYLRIVKTNYLHLLFRITTPVGSPFPATAGTPEGDKFPPAQDEAELKSVVEQILQRERTKEVVLYLMGSTS